MTYSVLLLSILSIVACHKIAKARGGAPVFWGLMGGLFGPLAIPFCFFVKPRADS